MLTETQWQQYEHKTARTGFFVQKRDDTLSRNSIQYQSGGPVRDDDYEQQAESYAEDGDGYDWTPELPPPADLARQIKAQYSAGDIATLVAELASIPY